MPTSQGQNFVKYGPIHTEFFLFILQIFSFIWIKYQIRPIIIANPLKNAFFAANRQCRYLRHNHSNQRCAALLTCTNLWFQFISWFIFRYYMSFWNLHVLFVCTNTVLIAKWAENSGNWIYNFLVGRRRRSLWLHNTVLGSAHWTNAYVMN